MNFRSNRLFFQKYIFAWASLVPGIACTEPAASEANVPEIIVERERGFEPEMEAAREREQGADEDPLAQRQAELIDRPGEWSSDPDEVRLYGSARVRYRETDAKSFWGDGGSRIGLSGHWQFKPYTWFFGRGEAGINILDQLDLLINRGGSTTGNHFGDTVFLRLLYVGIENPGYMVTVGKNWSTYYQVSSFTDRFQGTGASASGTFNVGTDGGFSGTGRADRVIQSRILIGAKPFKINVQLQHGEQIPNVSDFNYRTTLGLSTLLETSDELTVGLAYNHATIDSADLAALREYGIDGDATALAIGVRWFGDDWYVGSVLSRLDNHEATDEFVYFDGLGWEVYGQYNLHNNWWGVAGWNFLEPDSDEVQAGDFEVRYGVIGVRYTFRDFQQMVFTNARIDSGKTQDGTGLGNIYTIGVRWDLP